MKFKAIIFDMDGVLVETLSYILRSFNILLDRHGIKLSDEDRKKSLGTSLRDQIKMWKENYNIKEEIDPIKFSKEAFEIELDLMKKEVKPNKGLVELLEDAKKKGLKLAVATSSTADRAKELISLSGLTKFFDVIITSEDVDKHKPHPDIFLKAAEKIGVNPINCLVFEDALNGVKAAKGGNMKVVAILTKFNSSSEFTGVADLIIKDFSEVNLSKLDKLFP